MVSIDAARDGVFLRPFPARRLRLRRAPLPPADLPAASPDRGVWGFPTHALGRDTHAPILPAPPRAARGWAGRGGVRPREARSAPAPGRWAGGTRWRCTTARGAAVGCVAWEDLQGQGGTREAARRGGGVPRRKRDANFVVVVVVVVGKNEVDAGEGGGGVGWLAAVCASAVRPPSRYVSFWPGLPLLPHTSGVGAVRRRPVVVPWCWAAPARGGRREEEASASASPPSRRAWTRSVVGGRSFRVRSLFWLGWGPVLSARLVGVGPG
nr:unnamed protein product [Digitaria exilis]